ncbi:MAG: hypothetical protein ACI90V_012036 [Bacillariaceae sp.]|jgi:hypothetical protein
MRIYPPVFLFSNDRLFGAIAIYHTPGVISTLVGGQMENHQDDAIFVLQRINMIVCHTFKKLGEG